MHNYKLHFFLHNYKRKDGTRQVYLNAVINSDRSKIPLKIYCKASDFKNGIIKNDSYGNSIIENSKIRALEVFQKARFLNKPLNKSRFEYLYHNEGLEKDFIIYMRDKMQSEGKKNKYSLGTFKNWKKTFNKLKDFKSSIQMFEIDERFIYAFDDYLSGLKCTTGTNKGKYLAHNTITAHHRRLAKFVRLAIKDLELNINDPYEDFSRQYIKGERAFLTPDEINNMVQLYDFKDFFNLPNHLSETLRQFLFMVGSGLRISDSGSLEGLNIRKDSIRFRAQKTKNWKMAVNLPISKFSKRYLNNNDGKIFKYSDCQTINKNLKTICKMLDIDKNITSHSARHTFATSFILAGGKVETLKELLGHSDIRTTMIYVHITKEVERKELKLLDEFLFLG